MSILFPPAAIFGESEFRRLSEEITRYGGLNPRGEPKYRIVWGGNRTALRFTKWADGQIEPRRVLKYPRQSNRFHMEAWMPPEFYGCKEEWEFMTREVINGIPCYTLGEFPHRGDYEQIEIFQHAYICECGLPRSKWDWGPKNEARRQHEWLEVGMGQFIEGPPIPDQHPPVCGTCGEDSSFIRPTMWHCTQIIECHKATLEANKEEIMRRLEEAEKKPEEEALALRRLMQKDFITHALHGHAKVGYGELSHMKNPKEGIYADSIAR